MTLVLRLNASSVHDYICTYGTDVLRTAVILSQAIGSRLAQLERRCHAAAVKSLHIAIAWGSESLKALGVPVRTIDGSAPGGLDSSHVPSVGGFSQRHCDWCLWDNLQITFQKPGCPVLEPFFSSNRCLSPGVFGVDDLLPLGSEAFEPQISNPPFLHSSAFSSESHPLIISTPWMAIQHAFFLVTCAPPFGLSLRRYGLRQLSATTADFASQDVLLFLECLLVLLVLVAFLYLLLQSSPVDDVPDVPKSWDWISRVEFGLCSPNEVVQIKTHEDSQVQSQVVSPLLHDVLSSSTIYESAMSLSFGGETEPNVPDVSFPSLADDGDQGLHRSIAASLSRSLLCSAPSLNNNLPLLDPGESFSCFIGGVSKSSVQTHRRTRPSLLVQRTSRNPASPIVTTSTSPSFDCPSFVPPSLLGNTRIVGLQRGVSYPPDQQDSRRFHSEAGLRSAATHEAAPQ